MVTYQPRSAWTELARGGSQLTGSQLVGLAVHWPGTTTNSFGVESEAEVASRIRGWRDYHVDGRGWSDVGYNAAIDQAGRVWDLRGIDRVGAHAASSTNSDANHEYVGVLLILGDSEQPSTAMINAFRHFRRNRFLKHWPGRTQIRGHQQVPGAQTSCPGPYALELVNDGTLGGTPRPEPDEPEDDMTPEQEAKLDDVHRLVTTYLDAPIAEKTNRIYAIVERMNRRFTDVVQSTHGGHTFASRLSQTPNIVKHAIVEIQALRDSLVSKGFITTGDVSEATATAASAVVAEDATPDDEPEAQS